MTSVAKELAGEGVSPAGDGAALGRTVRAAVVAAVVSTFGFERAESLARVP
jgi:hypothetical protein